MSNEGSFVVLPSSGPNQVYVTVSALQAGHLTLPEKLFVTDADPERRATVPSLSFLVRHPSTSNNAEHPAISNLIFDLGLKRDIAGYRTAQQHHISQRHPITLHPDVSDSLAKGGLTPQDVNTVMLSHVHWDHIGTPSDFIAAEFVVGSGTMHILAHGDGPLYPAELFNAHELPHDRTLEFPPVHAKNSERAYERQTQHTWLTTSWGATMLDFYGDGSVYVVDAPGHLTGHVNFLARIEKRKWVYLGGDCCHDPRILHGEKGIAMYDDGKGGTRSVHMDTESARGTVDMVRRLMGEGRVRDEEGQAVEVEVVVAHDRGWAEANEGRFWPGKL